jgi:hypothetical protein
MLIEQYVLIYKNDKAREFAQWLIGQFLIFEVSPLGDMAIFRVTATPDDLKAVTEKHDQLLFD